MSQPNASPVQTVQRNTWTSGTTFTFTVAAPTNGNMGIIAFAFNGTTISVSGISQTGTTWVKGAANTTATNKDAEVWYGLNYSSGGTTITVTMSGTPASDPQLGGVFMEWADSGGATSGYSNDAAGAGNNGTTNATSGTLTPTAGVNALAVFVAKSNGAFSGSPSAGFTEVAASTSQPGNFRVAYQVITPTSGGYVCSYTSTGTWGAAMAFLTTPGGGGATTWGQQTSDSWCRVVVGAG